MEIESYYGPRYFLAIFLLALEPQGGSRDERKTIFIVLNLSLNQTLGSVTNPWAPIGGKFNQHENQSRLINAYFLHLARKG